MTAVWIDKPDNPGMANLGLECADIYGGVEVVNIADLTWRVALTDDFVTFAPVTGFHQLTDPGWLTRIADVDE
jgi:hypothetical protein